MYTTVPRYIGTHAACVAELHDKIVMLSQFLTTREERVRYNVHEIATDIDRDYSYCCQVWATHDILCDMLQQRKIDTAVVQYCLGLVTFSESSLLRLFMQDVIGPVVEVLLQQYDSIAPGIVGHVCASIAYGVLHDEIYAFYLSRWLDIAAHFEHKYETLSFEALKMLGTPHAYAIVQRIADNPAHPWRNAAGHTLQAWQLKASTYFQFSA